MSLSLSTKLGRFPPCACRLLARKKRAGADGCRDMSDAELAKRSGLDLSMVKRLSFSASWDDITVGTMMAFTKACGIDLDDRISIKRQYQLICSGAGSHLRTSPRWPMYAEILRAMGG